MDTPDAPEEPRDFNLQVNHDNNRTSEAKLIKDLVDLTTDTSTEVQLRKHNHDEDGSPGPSSKRHKLEHESNLCDEGTLQETRALQDHIDELKSEIKRLSLRCDIRCQDVLSSKKLLQQERQAKADLEQRLEIGQQECEAALQSQKSAEAECAKLQKQLDEKISTLQETNDLNGSYETVIKDLMKKKTDVEKKLEKSRADVKAIKKEKKEADQGQSMVSTYAIFHHGINSNQDLRSRIRAGKGSARS